LGCDVSTWKKISAGEALDSLAVGMYDEFVWYKAEVPDTLEEITLSARHLFALFINGQEVLNRNSYKYEKLQQIEETLSVKLDKKYLNKGKNELTILVQNVGFDKGFSGETNHPRGLVEFSTVPKMELDFYVKEKLYPERMEWKSLKESDSAYLKMLSTTFKADLGSDFTRSKYLLLEKFPYNRATIFLNGVKIGRYLKNNRNHSIQEKFYLIDTFLKPENRLDIVVWGREAKIKAPWGFKLNAKHVIIQVGNEQIHQLY
jgi:hypothetical protein